MVRHIYRIDPNHTRRMETGSDKEGPMHAARQWIDAVFPGDTLDGLAKLAKVIDND